MDSARIRALTHLLQEILHTFSNKVEMDSARIRALTQYCTYQNPYQPGSRNGFSPNKGIDTAVKNTKAVMMSGRNGFSPNKGIGNSFLRLEGTDDCTVEMVSARARALTLILVRQEFSLERQRSGGIPEVKR